jgi:2EXR family
MKGRRFIAVLKSFFSFMMRKTPAAITETRQSDSSVPSVFNHAAGEMAIHRPTTSSTPNSVTGEMVSHQSTAIPIPNSTTSEIETPQFVNFPELPTELRLKIWRYAFNDLEAPRVVEIRTRPHFCAGHKDWCPRYSPNPPPTIALVNLEARDVALKLAKAAGHIFFASSMTFSGDDIFFNPAADTLYIPNDKGQWIYGSDGIMTHFCQVHDPDTVRILALDASLYDLDNSSIFGDLCKFSALEELIFVVPEFKEGMMKQYDAARADMVYYRKRHHYFIPNNDGTYRMNSVKCHLAIKKDGGLRIIEDESP